eukprot:scaffold20530_cov68-Phaeocystis_antarctica.AAC.3
MEDHVTGCGLRGVVGVLSVVLVRRTCAVSLLGSTMPPTMHSSRSEPLGFRIWHWMKAAGAELRNGTRSIRSW